ncbi:hypothetical protein GJ496_000722 [Pomphorhynchus laevis]|nr:hypothetical protein GJ496_000722 [Pomphorhynchus laevis]
MLELQESFSFLVCDLLSVRKLARILHTGTVTCDDTVISQESKYAPNSSSSYRDYETSRVMKSDNHVSYEEEP